jgi:hypothetical protein
VQRPSRTRAGLPGKFIALGLQHGMRAKRSPEGVRSTPDAGGLNATNSRREATEAGLVRSFLRPSEETSPVPEESVASWAAGRTTVVVRASWAGRVRGVRLSLCGVPAGR